MKKLFLLSALALGAMTMSAQITKIGTVQQELRWTGCSDIGNVLYSTDETRHNITIYDNTLQNPKSITIQNSYQTEGVWISVVARNIFTTDGKACVLYNQYVTNTEITYRSRPATVKIIDEDGIIIKDFGDCTGNLENSEIAYIDGAYYLLIPKFGTINETDVYLLPGNGQPTDLESPTAPVRTSNARKVVENGQMYIILDGVKYAVTGSTTM